MQSQHLLLLLPADDCANNLNLLALRHAPTHHLAWLEPIGQHHLSPVAANLVKQNSVADVALCQ